jgi:hypothetical protein
LRSFCAESREPTGPRCGRVGSISTRRGARATRESLGHCQTPTSSKFKPQTLFCVQRLNSGCAGTGQCTIVARSLTESPWRSEGRNAHSFFVAVVSGRLLSQALICVRDTAGFHYGGKTRSFSNGPVRGPISQFTQGYCYIDQRSTESLRSAGLLRLLPAGSRWNAFARFDDVSR